MPYEAFQIRIEGHTTDTEVRPDTLSAGDLARLLERIEQAIVGTADPDGVAECEGPFLSLVAIEKGSARLALQIDPLGVDAARRVTNAIRTGQFLSLPESVQAVLHELWKMAHRKLWRICFERSDIVGMAEAAIEPDREIPSIAEISGVTTIYGHCVRVGGEDHPAARIRLYSGQAISVRVPTEMAKKLAKRLYEEVALEGEATWSARSMDLIRFRATRVVSFRPVNLLEAFDELRQAGGKAWDDIDAEQYLREFRAD